jgi:hypothetical protein
MDQILLVLREGVEPAASARRLGGVYAMTCLLRGEFLILAAKFLRRANKGKCNFFSIIASVARWVLEGRSHESGTQRFGGGWIGRGGGIRDMRMRRVSHGSEWFDDCT